MNTPKITANRFWTPHSVRQTCITHDLYTGGDCEEYEKMLDRVRNCEPTTENLYVIAKDIQEHSNGQTITNVMFLLEKDAVMTTFEIDGQDDI
ncbi:MAG: hypothetical protein HFF62_04145 [Oscillospiraceae bacterium]|nr:hypothetical protein [Oscillospiraceae bacterium]